MVLDFRRATNLTGWLLLFACSWAPLRAVVSCTGIPAWSATTTYAAGAQVTYSGSLYKALVSTTNVPPNYCPACLWWQLVDVCGTTSSCTTIPAVPSGLSASSITSSSVNLAWGAVASPANCSVTYSVYRGGSLAVSGLTGTSTSITGLAANTSYSFTVTAVDAAGSSAQSAALSVTTGVAVACTAAPSVPTGLSASGITSSGVSLAWAASTAGSGCSVTYNVYQKGTRILTVPTTTAVVSGLAASTTYSFTVASVDAAGTSAQGAALSVKTSAAVSTNLPKRIMSGYWHTWGGGPGFIHLADVNPNWDVINVAFATPVNVGGSDGQMIFSVTGDPAYTDAMFKADIKTLQGRGKKIVLSIGGYTGYFSIASAGAASTFVNGIKGFINAYGFNGIDIDMEQTSVQLSSGADPDFRNPTSPKVVYLISALQQICSAYGSNFILSWAPETFYLQLGYQYYGGLNPYVDPRAGDYIPLIYALRAQTTYVQAQLYNSGTILGADGNYYSMGDGASLVEMCKMLLTGFNVNENASYFFPALRPDQVVIGVPASANAAGSGLVSNAVLDQAFSTLNASYPGLRGIMAWSINWDNFQNANGFAIANRAYLNTLP